MTRRNFMKSMAAAGATTAILPEALAKLPRQNNPSDGNDSPRSGEFYFVHLTDPHVRQKRKGDEGFRKCLNSIKTIHPPVDFVLTGGDLVFDGCYTPKEEYLRTLDIFKNLCDESGLKFHHGLGNHDPLGWSIRRKLPVTDPDIGEALIVKKMEMPSNYYSFDHKGWHFVVLDSACKVDTPEGPTQSAKLGKEQLDWLGHDLGKNHGKPIIAVIHVAAFCAWGEISGDPDYNPIKAGMIIQDNKELRLMLERHQVKALLQGHSHIAEEYNYKDVWYITTPSAGACWWAGEWLGFKPGYTLFHCNGNQLNWKRLTYPLEYHLEPEDDLERKLTAEYEATVKEQKRLAELEIKSAAPENIQVP
jgi:3',5'-cyclic AMP phosphodiesterase CpdA